MKKLVQVNVQVACGSHGVIAEEIGRMAIARGWDSTIVYGREPHGESASRLIRVGDDMDMRRHGLMTRLFDAQGLSSRRATRRLVRQLSELEPDVVHLHNIHGYYLNYPILFRWLKEWGGPVVWTFHDCWPFTGHCAHFMFEGCDKWQTGCHRCALKSAYPSSIVLDRSARNYWLKKEYFTSLGDDLHIVSCSQCVADYTRLSFFNGVDIRCIPNGIDLNVFKPMPVPKSKKNQILGVSNIWFKSKGLGDFFELRKILPAEYTIVLVGLDDKQIDSLPQGICGIKRTSNRGDLARLYAESAVFVNPTYEDNFPTVNIEALACGTPVVTYRTGGSLEAVDAKTGVVVEQGDVQGLAEAVGRAERLNPVDCRARAVARFNKDDRYAEYLTLYDEILL